MLPSLVVVWLIEEEIKPLCLSCDLVMTKPLLPVRKEECTLDYTCLSLVVKEFIEEKKKSY